MNNKNPDTKNSVASFKPTIQANRIEFEKQIKNELMAHDINNDKIKVFAIYQLILQLMHSVELALFVADTRSSVQIAALMPHNAFMWTMEAWQERRNYGVQWMKVVGKATNRAWLDDRKMQVDLRQLNELALSILLSYIEKEKNEEAFSVARSVQEYRNLDETLPKELIANTKKWNRHKLARTSFDRRADVIIALEQRYLRVNFNDKLTQKIKERYIKRHSEISVEKAAFAVDTQMNALRKQIDEYKERTENDASIANYKDDVYNNMMALLRIKLVNTEKEFVTREVETENMKQILESGIAKMKSKYAYLQAKLLLYRTAVQQFNEGIISDFTALRSSTRSLELTNKSVVILDKSSKMNMSNNNKESSV